MFLRYVVFFIAANLGWFGVVSQGQHFASVFANSSIKSSVISFPFPDLFPWQLFPGHSQCFYVGRVHCSCCNDMHTWCKVRNVLWTIVRMCFWRTHARYILPNKCCCWDLPCRNVNNKVKPIHCPILILYLHLCLLDTFFIAINSYTCHIPLGYFVKV